MEVAIGAAEELVAAADREQRRTRRDRLAHAVGLCDQVLCHQGLLAILAAADVEQIVLVRIDPLSHGDGADVELVPAPRRAL